jgi:hypothetical protein
MRTRLWLLNLTLLIFFTMLARVAYSQQENEPDFKLLFQSFTEPINRVFSVNSPYV